MSVFWALQHYRMTHVEDKASRTRSEVEHSVRLMSALDERIDQLALKCQALWEIVRTETSLSDSDIRAKIHEIDMRDGVSDGKITNSGKQCSECGRTVGRRHERCLYCGKAADGKEVFET